MLITYVHLGSDTNWHEPITTGGLGSVFEKDEKKKEKIDQSINSLAMLIAASSVPSQSRTTACQTVRMTWAGTPWWKRCFSRGTRLSSTQKPLRMNVSGRARRRPLSTMRTVPDNFPFFNLWFCLKAKKKKCNPIWAEHGSAFETSLPVPSSSLSKPTGASYHIKAINLKVQLYNFPEFMIFILVKAKRTARLYTQNDISNLVFLPVELCFYTYNDIQTTICCQLVPPYFEGSLVGTHFVIRVKAHECPPMKK